MKTIQIWTADSHAYVFRYNADYREMGTVLHAFLQHPERFPYGALTLVLEGDREFTFVAGSIQSWQVEAGDAGMGAIIASIRE